ncbi:hypothetical protein D8827_04105 [Streptococcus intermedius]|uniref:Uncharacterized protein n=1 Tax=Streptococcus intermedius TaxID=1338 RepID=A0AAE8KCJ0_STRIT|nr:hypothetical protein [Streptococcus intermedius]RSJ23698.1 hypothetical protein D8827_04105 [Streptococcus intermedius]
MKEYSVIYNQRYFAIVEDKVADIISRISRSNRVHRLDDSDVWDDVIENYQDCNMQYVVLDEDDSEMICDYFG